MTPLSSEQPPKPIPKLSAADVFPHRTDIPRDDSYTQTEPFHPPVAITQVPPQTASSFPLGTYQLVLCFIIEADGSVKEAKVVDSSQDAAFDQACLDMIRKWRFSPAISGGKRIAVGSYLPVSTYVESAP